jgi:hypothetical protein
VDSHRQHGGTNETQPATTRPPRWRRPRSSPPQRWPPRTGRGPAVKPPSAVPARESDPDSHEPLTAASRTPPHTSENRGVATTVESAQ